MLLLKACCFWQKQTPPRLQTAHSGIASDDVASDTVSLQQVKDVERMLPEP